VSSNDDLLYHYTTLESFIGIIESGELWASHIRYLNDTSEMNLMWELVRSRIEARRRDAENAARDRLDQIQQFAASPLNQDIYLISFSKDGGDRLSQWRGYGGGAGIAIGFDPKQVKKRCTTTTPVRPYKVQTPAPLPMFAVLNEAYYVDPLVGDERSNGIIDTFIDNIINSAAGTPLSREHVNRTISFYSPNLKHLAFKEEKEWRVIILDHAHDLPTRFRTRKSMMVPYLPFKLGTEVYPLISRVIVGPSPHQQETIAAVSKRLGSDEVEIIGSRIPHRDW
jgi:Protein of unknown function (DUF2971)